MEKENVYDTYTNVRSKIIASIGIIITIIAIALIFFISSLEGTQQVKAGSYTNGKLLGMWREEEGVIEDDIFPAPYVTIIEYNDKEYYYVEEYGDDGQVEKWYFAFEGGIAYVFDDYKYYVLTAIVGTIAIFVSYINFVSAKNSSKESDKFISTLMFYKESKERAKGWYQYIPNFCVEKNKEKRNEVIRNIVEEAGLNYDEYIAKTIKYDSLEKWQTKSLKKVKKIKIRRLSSTDLLQEKGTNERGKIRMLPMGEKEKETKFILKAGFQRILTVAMSGSVVAFGVVLGNWVLGATYGITIAIGAVTSTVAGTDFVFNTLRNRYIAKADYLNEFADVKDKYIFVAPVIEEKKKEDDSVWQLQTKI